MIDWKERQLTLEESIELYILAIYSDSDKCATIAAKRLGISRQTLYRKLYKYGVKCPPKGKTWKKKSK